MTYDLSVLGMRLRRLLITIKGAFPSALQNALKKTTDELKLADDMKLKLSLT